MIALLIGVDFTTGKRAGGIKVKNNPNLVCRGWQDVDAGLEIRLVVDGNISPYEGVSGVTILEGEEAINEAIEKHIPVKYKIEDMSLLLAHANQRSISFDEFIGKNQIELAEHAYKRGLAGVTERKPGRI